MKKKIILLTFFFIVLVSCGKKADPEYKVKKYISDFKMQSNI